ncbi:MAG: type IX secretion system membrane protein PorP/SprF [Bacteroidia bacterium]|jgi:type IX secretion system PorP/SprF family membrane protein|nr:type IX secretion system membrane protein PorP/SprF [Bacteroidia bacterium]MCC6767432.1 type IX secretion system membrane protein PorP/SprF [Bacteroidia bacterium]
MMKKIATVLSILAFSLSTFAQQELQVSQYMFNGLFLNPAYAGSHDYWGATALHRSQWVGFPGAPRSNMLAVDGPIKDKNMGLGFQFINDGIGLMATNELAANYSYYIKVNEKGHRLAFGIRAGIRNETFNASGLENVDMTDPLYQGNQSWWIPRFNFGMYYYTERGYLGISSHNLLFADARHKLDSDAGLKRHFFINGGYVWDLNSSGSVKFKPSFLVKYQPAAPIQADINAHFLFDDKFWVGVSYRTNAAIVGMIEYQFTPRIRAGYAYDYTTTAMRQFQGGSHEIMLGYDFIAKISKFKHPRYF